MGRKTPPFINCQDMTISAFWTPIRSDLRRRWMKFPERKKAILNARVGKLKSVKTGRMVFHVECAKCHESLPEMDKGFEVDHLIDAGGLKCFEDLPGFVDRLFCEAKHLQIICKDCHKEKTIANRKK